MNIDTNVDINVDIFIDVDITGDVMGHGQGGHTHRNQTARTSDRHPLLRTSYI